MGFYGTRRAPGCGHGHVVYRWNGQSGMWLAGSAVLYMPLWRVCARSEKQVRLVDVIRQRAGSGHIWAAADLHSRQRHKGLCHWCCHHVCGRGSEYTPLLAFTLVRQLFCRLCCGVSLLSRNNAGSPGKVFQHSKQNMQSQHNKFNKARQREGQMPNMLATCSTNEIIVSETIC